MIEATELRIGNWVYPNEENRTPYSILAISKNHVTCFYTEHHWQEDVTITLNDLQPIELTPEILEAAGFVNTSNFHPEGVIFSITIQGITFEVCIGYHFIDVIQNIGRLRVLRIKHLHQLQNLYHLLTGEELYFNDKYFL